METKVIARPARLSYSSIALYDRCPAAWRYTYIERRPSPAGKAAERGTRLHSTIERYLRGEIPDEALPVELWRIRRQLLDLIKAAAEPEAVWLISPAWERVDRDEDAAVKAVIDAHYYDAGRGIVHLVDFKSGREHASHADQLQLYAAAAFSVYPDAAQAEVSALYIDTAHTGCACTYPREWAKNLRGIWSNKMEKVRNDEELKATPSKQSCRWCPHAVQRGGPCTQAQGI